MSFSSTIVYHLAYIFYKNLWTPYMKRLPLRNGKGFK